MRRAPWLAMACVLLLTAVPSSPAHAQVDPDVTVNGMVTGPDGKPAQNTSVSVTVQVDTTTKKVVVSTDNDGNYTAKLSGVPAGTATVDVTAKNASSSPGNVASGLVNVTGSKGHGTVAA